MKSVRVTAAGAVVFACLAFLTAPVSACDDRFIKKCERESAPPADEQAAPEGKRKGARAHIARRMKHARAHMRTRAAESSRPSEREVAMAAAKPARPESALARRFRGFIDPQPMAHNAFEALRPPYLAAESLEPTDIPDPVPAIPQAIAEPANAVPPVAARQDKAPTMELAAAESRPVALAAAAEPIPAIAPAPRPVEPQAVASSAPPVPGDGAPSRFSIHQLVLALCGALGAASALRFIVGS